MKKYIYLKNKFDNIYHLVHFRVYDLVDDNIIHGEKLFDFDANFNTWEYIFYSHNEDRVKPFHLNKHIIIKEYDSFKEIEKDYSALTSFISKIDMV